MMVSAGFPSFFTDRSRGVWLRRGGRAGTGTDAAFFPGYGGKKIRVDAFTRAFLSFRLSLRSDEELEFSFPLASLRGREGQRHRGLSPFGHRKEEGKGPGGQQGGEKAAIAVRFHIDLPTAGGMPAFPKDCKANPSRGQARKARKDSEGAGRLLRLRGKTW